MDPKRLHLHRLLEVDARFHVHILLLVLGVVEQADSHPLSAERAKRPIESADQLPDNPVGGDVFAQRDNPLGLERALTISRQATRNGSTSALPIKRSDPVGYHRCRGHIAELNLGGAKADDPMPSRGSAMAS